MYKRQIYLYATSTPVNKEKEIIQGAEMKFLRSKQGYSLFDRERHEENKRIANRIFTEED